MGFIGELIDRDPSGLYNRSDHGSYNESDGDLIRSYKHLIGICKDATGNREGS